MNKVKKLNKNISRPIAWTSVLLLAIPTIIGFLISYNGLYHLCMQVGMEKWLCYLWPLLFDTVCLVQGVNIFRKGLRGEQSIISWLIVIVFGALTIFFNVLSVYDFGFSDLAISVMVHFMPPTVFVISMAVVKSVVSEEFGVFKEESELVKVMKATDISEENVIDLILNRSRKEDTSGKVEIVTNSVNDRREQLVSLIEKSPDSTQDRFAELLGVSKATIRRDLAALDARKNGNGWKVVG